MYLFVGFPIILARVFCAFRGKTVRNFRGKWEMLPHNSRGQARSRAIKSLDIASHFLLYFSLQVSLPPPSSSSPRFEEFSGRAYPAQITHEFILFICPPIDTKSSVIIYYNLLNL